MHRCVSSVSLRESFVTGLTLCDDSYRTARNTALRVYTVRSNTVHSTQHTKGVKTQGQEDKERCTPSSSRAYAVSGTVLLEHFLRPDALHPPFPFDGDRIIGAEQDRFSPRSSGSRPRDPTRNNTMFISVETARCAARICEVVCVECSGEVGG